MADVSNEEIKRLLQEAIVRQVQMLSRLDAVERLLLAGESLNPPQGYPPPPQGYPLICEVAPEEEDTPAVEDAPVVLPQNPVQKEILLALDSGGRGVSSGRGRWVPSGRLREDVEVALTKSGYDKPRKWAQAWAQQCRTLIKNGLVVPFGKNRWRQYAISERGKMAAAYVRKLQARKDKAP